MSLNPLRNLMTSQAPLEGGHESPFRNLADTALAGFRGLKADLERQVRKGDLTPKVARERADAFASGLREQLNRRAEDYSPAPREFLGRLVQADELRRRSREVQSPSALQREANRLLRDLLLEQQVVNRRAEFEARASVRPIGGGPAVPTLESLLEFQRLADLAGDDSAREWGRRELEAFRPRAASEEDRRQIDLATDRPDRVNVRVAGRYVDAIRARPESEQAEFAERALEAGDANACVAAFLLAREAPDGLRANWVRKLLDGLSSFPDSAIVALRACEAEARDAEAREARTVADRVAELAEAEAKLPILTSPTVEELERLGRVSALPVAGPDEPIGLALERRGRSRLDEPAEAAVAG